MSALFAKELREKYLKFFEKKGHKIIPSAPLIPENDPTVLFTTAGMHPLVPYLLGEKHPLGRRLVNSQKCIRTNDIDDVGDATHLTFFEMLGNWSLGDYFKQEAIEWSCDFLTKELNIPLEKLAFSVFEGESKNNIPRDDEAAEIWQGLGVKKERLAYLGRKDNWWGPAGKTGPCGPDTEMFYWTGQEPAPAVFDPSDKKWVEIWNNVFMQYEKRIKNQESRIKNNEEGEYEFAALAQKNVDTGMGLERVAAILQEKSNVYETELFTPIIENLKSKIENLKFASKISNLEKEKAIRIIADHIKAAVFLSAERLAPSNTERGYILRRLIRRAVRYGKLLGIENNFTVEIAKTVIEIYQDVYFELKENKQFIFTELKKEEEKFLNCLEKGLKILRTELQVKDYIPGRRIENIPDISEGFTLHKDLISGKWLFDFYQTFGFPPDLIFEELQRRDKIFSREERDILMIEFKKEIAQHQELSRTASVGQFKSGLADDSEQTTKYHTATHLLLSALRQVLGNDVQQKGSNITAERLRFDFNFSRKMTAEEIKKAEDLVNEKIKANLPVICEEMTTEQAFAKGAVGIFGHKYADKVKVYTIGIKENVCSKEICAGPHVERTDVLGNFKIIKEESSSSGIRRIKAVLVTPRAALGVL